MGTTYLEEVKTSSLEKINLDESFYTTKGVTEEKQQKVDRDA